MNHFKMLEEAASLAYSSRAQKKRFLLGCIALREDGAYVRSTNTVTFSDKAPSGHAEAKVLKKAGGGATLWVARSLRNESWGLAKPCIGCQTLIANKRVKRIYFTIGPGQYSFWDP